MRLFNEDQLLNIDVRLKIIQEICSDEEQFRRDAKFKEYELLKGKNQKYIWKQLERLYHKSTLEKLKYAFTNFAFNKKIIKKLARVYENGAARSITGNEDQTNNMQILSQLLDMNIKMKSTNEGLRQSYNMAMFVKPYLDQEKYKIDLVPLFPWQYSVVEHQENRNLSICHVLSEYKIKNQDMRYVQQENPRLSIDAMNRTTSPGDSENWYQKVKYGDGKDQKIADNYYDQDNNTPYYFWSKKYHFVCNKKGEILSKETGLPILNPSMEDLMNPVQTKTIIDFAINSENSFWSTEYNNICEADVMINCMLTNLNHIATVQGYGKFYMKGKDLPEFIIQSPDIAIKMEYDEGDPVPDLGYVNSTPQIAEMRNNIEMLLGLTLTTNNVSTSGFKLNLQDSNLASGISMILDKAESMEDVKDQRQVFYEKEAQIWVVIAKWLNLFNSNGSLDDSFRPLLLNEEEINSNFNIQFPQMKPISTEAEHLANLKSRKDLGINTMKDLILMDRPNLTEEEIDQILEEIKAEKQLNVTGLITDVSNEEPEVEEDNEEDGESN